MAEISDPRAVRFCNEDIRPEADALERIYWHAKAVLTAWQTQGLAALIPATADLLADGSPADGRAPITGAAVNGFITGLQFITTWAETAGVTWTATPDPTVTTPPLAGISSIAVNGIPE